MARVQGYSTSHRYTRWHTFVVTKKYTENVQHNASCVQTEFALKHNKEGTRCHSTMQTYVYAGI